jgi:hypothetical protein
MKTVPVWPFPTKEHPLTPWTPKQIKEYNQRRLSETQESPL